MGHRDHFDVGHELLLNRTEVVKQKRSATLTHLESMTDDMMCIESGIREGWLWTEISIDEMCRFFSVSCFLEQYISIGSIHMERETWDTNWSGCWSSNKNIGVTFFTFPSTTITMPKTSLKQNHLWSYMGQEQKYTSRITQWKATIFLVVCFMSSSWIFFQYHFDGIFEFSFVFSVIE